MCLELLASSNRCDGLKQHLWKQNPGGGCLAVCLHSSITRNEWPSGSELPPHDVKPSSERTKKGTWLKLNLLAAIRSERAPRKEKVDRASFASLKIRSIIHLKTQKKPPACRFRQQREQVCTASVVRYIFCCQVVGNPLPSCPSPGNN